MNKKDRLGMGGRFESMVRELKKKGYSKESAIKIAAKIGINKYGSKAMAKWSLASKKRNKKKKK